MRHHRELRNGARVGLARLSVEVTKAACDSARDRSSQLVGMELPVGHGDISMGGVGFKVDRFCPPLAVGDRILVRFQLPDGWEEYLVSAELRHVTQSTEGNQRAGACFLEADELVFLPIFRYVEESLLAIRATSESFAGQMMLP
ncbi:MAG: PilZ domain-containing protein [Myxococcales bacterium]|nr:PilZ domain-containing protein [Myxococcales bacterium]